MSTLIFGFTIQDLVGATLLFPLLIFFTLLLLRSFIQPEPAIFRVWVMTLSVMSPLVVCCCHAILLIFADEVALGHTIHLWGLHWGEESIGFPLLLQIDPLSLSFAVLVSLLTLFASWMGLDPEGSDRDYAEVAAVVCLHFFAIHLILWAATFPLLIIGWEILTVATVLLLRSWNFFGWSRLFNMIFLAAMIWFYYIVTKLPGYEGTMTIASLQDYRNLIPLGLGFCLMLPACFAGAQFPASLWLLRATRPPGAVLAVIFGGGSLIASLYWINRLYPVLVAHPSLQLFLEGLGIVSALIGSLSALWQRSIRRVIASLALGQIGLVMIAYGVGALSEGIIHGWVQLFLITTLLITVTPYLSYHPQERLNDSNRLPIDRVGLIALVVAASGIGAIMPVAGFLTRHDIFWSLITQERWLTVGATLLTSFILTIAAVRFIVAFWPAKQLRGRMMRWSSRHRVILLLLTLFFLGLTVELWRERLTGQGFLVTWFLPFLDQYLPIRSESYHRSFENVIALVSILIWFHVALVSAIVMTQRRAWVLRWSQRNERFLEGIERDFWIPTRYWKSIQNFLELAIEKILGRFFNDQLCYGLIVQGPLSFINQVAQGLRRLRSHLQLAPLFSFIALLFIILLWVTRGTAP